MRITVPKIIYHLIRFCTPNYALSTASICSRKGRWDVGPNGAGARVQEWGTLRPVASEEADMPGCHVRLCRSSFFFFFFALSDHYPPFHPFCFFVVVSVQKDPFSAHHKYPRFKCCVLPGPERRGARVEGRIENGEGKAMPVIQLLTTARESAVSCPTPPALVWSAS